MFPADAVAAGINSTAQHRRIRTAKDKRDKAWRSFGNKGLRIGAGRLAFYKSPAVIAAQRKTPGMRREKSVAAGEAGSRSQPTIPTKKVLSFIRYQIARPGQVRIALYGIIKATAGTIQEEFMISIWFFSLANVGGSRTDHLEILISKTGTTGSRGKGRVEGRI